MRRLPVGRLLRRATALAVPVVLSAVGLVVVGPAVLPAAAADPPKPRIKVTQAVDPTTYAKAGQVLTWTSVVTNFGNTTLRGLEVTDSAQGLSDRTCTPMKIGGTLAAGASTTCTATHAVTQADLDGDAGTSDTVTVVATTPEQQAPVKVTAAATAASTAKASPGLSLTVTASPTTVSLAGQQVAYAFVARNRGNQTLRDVLVTAPFPGLSALLCSPVAQGGTLAPGAATTCGATRTIAVADLGAGSLENSAKVEATTLGGERVANSGAVSVATKALPPIVRSYVSAAVLGGRPISLPGATTARPGETGGAAVDPTRTVFVGFDPRSPGAGKVIGTRHASWAILPDGSVRVTPALQYLGAGVDKVAYRVYDAAGRSTVGRLTVTIREGATAGAPLTATTLQNEPVTVDVLSHDDPGLNTDGTPSSFDRASLRLVKLDFGPEGDWSRPPVNYLDEGRRINIVGTGDYTAGTGGITFTPVAGFTGTPPPVGYAATSLTGSPDYNVLTVTVLKVAPPTTTPLAATVAYGQVAVLGAAAAAKAGDPSAPIDPASVVLGSSSTATDGGTTLVTSRGTWRARTDGSVLFTPANGFVGTTSPVGYSVADRNGTRASSRLTVTVRPGPMGVPDRSTTAQGTAVSLSPLANDVAGIEVDGSNGSFVVASLDFPVAGQPAGAAVSGAGHTLTVPGQGVWTAASGVVTFAPGAGFAGGAAPVSYAATDDLGNVATGRITVAVTSVAATAATDDEAATVRGASVRLPAATDDSPGSSPIVPASTVFPTTGQPASSTVSADARTLTVPGQGTWTLAADGSATFTPTTTYAGTTSPATYRVVDGTGRTATATLTVTVRPGPTGTPDTVTSQTDRVVVPLTQNDLPGRNADGTLGSVDPLTVRFAQTGQPKGWVVSEGGTVVSLPPDDGQPRQITVDPRTSVVTVFTSERLNGTYGPFVYTAQDTVRDASGEVRHHTLTSSVRVTFDQPRPVATDDHAVTLLHLGAHLAGQGNDFGGAPDQGSFPADQLGHLPAGSKLVGRTELFVAGEGTYEIIGLGPPGIAFLPVPAFTGPTTTPVQYQIENDLGQTARGTLTVSVVGGAEARPDAVTTAQNRPVNVDVTANDVLGPDLDGVPLPRSAYDLPTFSESGQPQGSKLGPANNTLSVPGEGFYEVNPANGTITFDPARQFAGAASPVRVVTRVNVAVPFSNPGDVAAELPISTLRVTVTATVPVAHADTASTAVGRPVVVKALANDVAGAPTAPLVGSSVRLRLAAGLPSGSTLSGDAKLLTVAGRGAFLAAGNGEITFVPLGSRTGVVPTVGYQVADANGTTTRSTLEVTVR